MKLVVRYSRKLSTILIVILLFQSCTIYNFKRATLDEAVESEKRTKIVLKSGKRLRYKKVIKIEGQYYGLKKKDTIQVDLTLIKKVKLKNTTASVISSTFFGAFVLLVIGIFTVDWNGVGAW